MSSSDGCGVVVIGRGEQRRGEAEKRGEHRQAKARKPKAAGLDARGAT